MVKEEDAHSVARNTYSTPEKIFSGTETKCFAIFGVTKSVVVISWTLISRSDNFNSLD